MQTSPTANNSQGPGQGYRHKKNGFWFVPVPWLFQFWLAWTALEVRIVQDIPWKTEDLCGLNI